MLKRSASPPGRQRRSARPKPQPRRKRGQKLSKLKRSEWPLFRQRRSARPRPRRRRGLRLRRRKSERPKPQPRRKRGARVRKPSNSDSPLCEHATHPCWAKATQRSAKGTMTGLSRPPARRWNSILRALSRLSTGASLIREKATTTEPSRISMKPFDSIPRTL